MKGEVSYRQLVLRSDGQVLRLPLTAPVNDLLGQLRPSARKNEADYLPWLSVRYAALGTQDGMLGAACEREVQEAFLEAAKSAAKGHVSANVAPYLERLRFAPDGTVADVPDFTSLAAWSLLEAVRRLPLKLHTCPRCKGGWLGSPDGSKYCQRVAPGQVSKDCRTLDYEKRLAGDSGYRAYRREYKRISEAFRRGAIDVQGLVAWREENGPAKWAPFAKWNEARLNRAGKEDRDG